MSILTSRRSYRSYEKRKIEDDKLERILYAGLCAASAKNRQDTKIVVVQDNETMKELSELNRIVSNFSFDPFYGAPILLIVFYPKETNTGKQDASLVMANLMLAAEEEGLGSCWINRAQEMLALQDGQKYIQKFDMEDYDAIGAISLGYSNETPKPKDIDMSRVIYDTIPEVFVSSRTKLIYRKDYKEVAYIRFAKVDKVYTISEVFVDESLRGEGVAAKLMQEMVKKLEKEQATCILECPYSIAYFEKHPEYAHLKQK